MPAERSVVKRKLGDPADVAFAITPDDDNDLPAVTSGIFVGTGGDLAVVLFNAKDGAGVIFKNLPDAFILPVRASRVLEAGTDASDLVGLL